MEHMNNDIKLGIYLLAVFNFGLIAFGAAPVSADDADVFFDDSRVHEIRIYFENSDWYTILYNSHDDDPDDPYFPARFEYGDTVLDPVGVRFKGNSSFSINTVKKSFKIDFNIYDDSMTFLDLKKLNLNNSFKDPSMLREKIFLDFARNFVPAMRVVHCNLYVNDVLWGLYTAVEQVDKTFCQTWFGDDEDGNLFKGAASDTMGSQDDFGSDLTWLGEDPDPYYEQYQLKTNEVENDYSQLIEFINILNNSSTAALPDLLEPVFDVPNALMGLALNNLFVNLDAYNGSAHNYYVYDRDDTGRFTHLHWDTNESFGRFLMFVSHSVNPLEMDPFWLPSPTGPPPQEEQDRPLMENLWAIDSYNREYLRDLALMLRSGFDVTTMEQRIDELADIIRSDVYADGNKMYSNADFEQNLYYDIQAGPETMYGLRAFVATRGDYLRDRLDDFAEQTDIRLNEIMSMNTQTIQDESGDYDPWIELYNPGPGSVNLTGMRLSDDPGVPGKWTLPSVVLDPGDFQLLWIDGESSEGASHANFSLNASGGTLYLNINGTEDVDTVTYPALLLDISYARLPDGFGIWETTDQASPGTANLPSAPPVALFINELMADNDNTVEDPEEPGAYEDWFEIYNPGFEDVDISGMYLTDDLDDPTQFLIPEGVIVPAAGYLLFWADDDTDQGTTHTNFKLSADGEAIGLFDTDTHGNRQVDAVVFGVQSTDVSYGRCPDGAEIWEILDVASPGDSNCQIVPTATPAPPTPTPVPTSTPGLCINNGDVNGNGSLTPEDALMTFQIYLGLISDPSDVELCSADCNGNSAVTPEDALCIFQHFVSGACDCADPLD